MITIKYANSRFLTPKNLRALSSKVHLHVSPAASVVQIGRSLLPLRTLHCFESAHSCTRQFSATRTQCKGLSPETEDPQPAEPEAHHSIFASEPAELTNEKYHELADEYLNALVEKLEQMQEQKEEVDVEYSAGVLTLTLPPHGTYVLNKQPANKQIWLSSPITGPKRYDYVMLSEGQDSKEGTGQGEWVYLRDESTLSDLLAEECGVVMASAEEGV